MKNVRTTVAKAVAATIIVSAAGFAAAAGTQNLNVTATVSGVCKFSSAVQTLTFGTVDPSVPGPIAGSGAAVTYKCTKGTAATGVTPDNGTNFSASRRMGNGTDFIPYSLTISGGTQTGLGFAAGAGTDLALIIGGSIVAADYQNVSAGAYSDTVVLTLAP